MGWILFFSSWFLVAFGQPSWFPILGIAAAICGFALFWMSLKHFKRRLLLSVIWYTGISCIQLSWMTANEFQGIYILFVYAGLALWLGLQFAAVTLLIKEQMSMSRMLAIASLWTLIEWARLFFICGFSFNPVGLALASTTLSLQLAAVGGIFGLTFCIWAANLFLYTRRYALWLACALLPYVFGAIQFLYHDPLLQQETQQYQAALVQTNLLPSEKIPLPGHSHSFISPLQQWRRIVEWLHKEKTRFDLIALPESALPFFSDENAYSLERSVAILHEVLGAKVLYAFPQVDSDRVSNSFWAQTLANYFDAEVLIGLDGQDHKTKQIFASAFHYLPQKLKPARYDKRVLVPLAEYLPYEWLRPLVARYGIESFFTQGAGPQVFRGKVPFSPSICYEETFPDLMREGKNAGAKLFINVTNDNWYPFSKLAHQHFSLGKVRAVENGLPLLRVGNSGITAAVDSLGRVVSQLSDDSGILIASVPLYQYSTLFSHWGEAGIIGMCIIFISIFFRISPRNRIYSC